MEEGFLTLLERGLVASCDDVIGASLVKKKKGEERKRKERIPYERGRLRRCNGCWLKKFIKTTRPCYNILTYVMFGP